MESRWSLISEIKERAASGNIMALYRCSCGTVRAVATSDVNRGASLSCGCYNLERTAESCITHGMSKSREFQAWCNMKERCYRERNKHYKNYGGRGIEVCSRWNDSFQNFFDDMGLKPTPVHSIDRINNNGNYEPSNCRWATRREQNLNTRTNHFVSSYGVRQTVTEWAACLEVPRDRIYDRIKKGWSEHDALFLPKGRRKPSSI